MFSTQKQSQSTFNTLNNPKACRQIIMQLPCHKNIIILWGSISDKSIRKYLRLFVVHKLWNAYSTANWISKTHKVLHLWTFNALPNRHVIVILMKKFAWCTLSMLHCRYISYNAVVCKLLFDCISYLTFYFECFI